LAKDNGRPFEKHNRAFPYKWNLKYDQKIAQEEAGNYTKGVFNAQEVTGEILISSKTYLATTLVYDPPWCVPKEVCKSHPTDPPRPFSLFLYNYPNKD
jgi:hypothetical protein